LEPRLNQVTFLWKNYSKGNQILLRRELLRAIFGDKAGDVKMLQRHLIFAGVVLDKKLFKER
jgi:hypothetical protein